MYTEHPSFIAPRENAALWRYMDFTKFVSLLDKSSLFFARADKLSDPFEGSFSPVNIAMRPSIYSAEIYQSQNIIASAIKDLRKYTLLNCWHTNDSESAAMWRLYAREHDGIAIKTTFKAFSQSFLCKDDVYIGSVQYVDYDQTFIPEGDAFSPFLHKRTSFEHENEVRALIWLLPQHTKQLDLNWAPYDIGSYYEVDLSLLIEEIVVAPYAHAWFTDLVSAVATRYGIAVPVNKSRLSDPPVWTQS